MGYPTDSAEWPKTVPKQVIQLLDQFFILVDTKSDSIGKRLAKEIFTRDGKFIATYGSFDGFEGMYLLKVHKLPFSDFEYAASVSSTWLTVRPSLAIETSRQGVWRFVRSRRHEVKQVFVCDWGGLDLVLAGVVEIETMDGYKHRHEFLVRVGVLYAETENPRVQRYQILVPVPRGQISILQH